MYRLHNKLVCLCTPGKQWTNTKAVAYYVPVHFPNIMNPIFFIVQAPGAITVKLALVIINSVLLNAIELGTAIHLQPSLMFEGCKSLPGTNTLTYWALLLC